MFNNATGYFHWFDTITIECQPTESQIEFLTDKPFVKEIADDKIVLFKDELPQDLKHEIKSNFPR